MLLIIESNASAEDLYFSGNDNLLLGLQLFDLEWNNFWAGDFWALKLDNKEKKTEIILDYNNCRHLLTWS